MNRSNLFGINPDHEPKLRFAIAKDVPISFFTDFTQESTRVCQEAYESTVNDPLLGQEQAQDAWTYKRRGYMESMLIRLADKHRLESEIRRTSGSHSYVIVKGLNFSLIQAHEALYGPFLRETIFRTKAAVLNVHRVQQVFVPDGFRMFEDGTIFGHLTYANSPNQWRPEKFRFVIEMQTEEWDCRRIEFDFSEIYSAYPPAIIAAEENLPLDLTQKAKEFLKKKNYAQD